MSQRLVHDEPRSDVRAAICRVVGAQPGIHFRALERTAGLSSAGQLRHHIDRLARQGRLVEVTDGGYKRYFLVGDHDRNLRPSLARFARPLPRRIATLLLARSMNRTELRRALGCADSTLGYYLKRMVRKGDLVRERGRNCCQYALADPDLVRRVLTLHERGAVASGEDGERDGVVAPSGPTRTASTSRPPRPVRDREVVEAS